MGVESSVPAYKRARADERILKPWQQAAERVLFLPPPPPMPARCGGVKGWLDSAHPTNLLFLCSGVQESEYNRGEHRYTENETT